MEGALKLPQGVVAASCWIPRDGSSSSVEAYPAHLLSGCSRAMRHVAAAAASIFPTSYQARWTVAVAVATVDIFPGSSHARRALWPLLGEGAGMGRGGAYQCCQAQAPGSDKV